jgi:hypothetical protein
MAPWTSPRTKCRIIELKKTGKKARDIKKELFPQRDLSERSINRIWNRYHAKENYNDVGKSSGRPKKLDERAARRATRHLANCDVRNATELQRTHFPEVDVQTVKRTLKDSGLGAHPRANVPLITKANLPKRKAWAREYRKWTQENWDQVIFSDESIYRVFGTDGIDWCWRRDTERLDPRFTKKNVKHGGGKVTVWGMITRDGPGRLTRIWGNMNKHLYREILEDDLLGSLDDLEMDRSEYYFQQDNDPKHTAGIVREWFEENHIDVLPWVSNSPDMNIIEHVWDRLDRMVRARDPLPRTEDQLWEALQEEWENLDVEYLWKLYDSMPRRVEELYRANGGTTHY